MKLKVLSIIALLFLALPLCAQNVVRGKVVDGHTGKGIESVTVQLLRCDSCFLAGGITSATGDFRIATDHEGCLLLNVTAVGYSPQQITLQGSFKKTLDVGSIALEEANIALGEVTVSAQRYVRKSDKVLIFPDQKQTKYAANGYDLLSNLQIPGLKVNRLEKEVTTQLGAATLYINGVKATYQEVQALRPKDIARVEYHDMPQGEFASDVVAVNYITKVRESDGYVTATAEQRVGYLHGDYMVASKFNKRKKTYSVLAGYETENNRTRSSAEEELRLSDELFNRSSDVSLSNPLHQQYAAFALTTKVNKDTWMVQAGYVRSNNPDWHTTQQVSYREWGQSTFSDNNVSQVSHKPYAYLYYFHPVNDRQWLRVEANVSYTRTDYERDYRENDPFAGGDYAYGVQSQEDYYRLVANLYYSWTFRKNNSLLFDLAHFQNNYTDRYSGDIEARKRLSSGETQLRLIYAQRFGKRLYMRLTLGGSLNVYSLRGEMHNTQFSPRPSLSLQYAINPKHTLTLIGYMGNSSPQVSLLSDVDQRVDILQLRRGNPDLDITRLASTKVQYTFLSNTFSLATLLQYEGLLNTVKPNYFEEEGLLVQSYVSDGNHHTVGLMASPSLSLLGNSLRVKCDLAFCRYILTGLYGQSQNEWVAGLEASYSFRNFQVGAYCASPRKQLYQSYGCDTPVMYGLSVGYFNKGWSMEVGTTNPFGTGDYREHLGRPIYSYQLSKVDKSVKAMAYVKLSYNFDFGKKVQKSNLDAHKGIDSAIFK